MCSAPMPAPLTRSLDDTQAIHRGRLLGTYLNAISHSAIGRGASETHISHAMSESFSSVPIHLYRAIAPIPRTVNLPSVKLYGRSVGECLRITTHAII